MLPMAGQLKWQLRRRPDATASRLMSARFAEKRQQKWGWEKCYVGCDANRSMQAQFGGDLTIMADTAWFMFQQLWEIHPIFSITVLLAVSERFRWMWLICGSSFKGLLGKKYYCLVQSESLNQTVTLLANTLLVILIGSEARRENWNLVTISPSNTVIHFLIDTCLRSTSTCFKPRNPVVEAPTDYQKFDDHITWFWCKRRNPNFSPKDIFICT